MPRVLMLVLIVLAPLGCLRERFRREGREPVALPDRAPPAAQPMALPKPPPPPPLKSEPLPPQPPKLPEVAPPLVNPTPVESGVSVPTTLPTPTPAVAPSPAPSGGDVAAVRALVAAARRRTEEVESYECRLTKREVVHGKAMPQDEIVYRLRRQPFSIYMKVLSDAGKGRELLYVAGQNGNQIAVLTGQGDNVLVGVGYRTNLAPDSRQALSKSRYKITDAGFQRTLTGLEKAAATAEAGRPGGVKALGLVNRPESIYALEAVEVMLAPGSDPLLTKGGRRRVHFDPKPDAPGYRLPVLIETFDHTGQEVEYYSFHDLVVPCPTTAWDPARLGK